MMLNGNGSSSSQSVPTKCQYCDKEYPCQVRLVYHFLADHPGVLPLEFDDARKSKIEQYTTAHATDNGAARHTLSNGHHRPMDDEVEHNMDLGQLVNGAVTPMANPTDTIMTSSSPRSHPSTTHPHQCHICPRSYTEIQNLKRHVKNSHHRTTENLPSLVKMPTQHRSTVEESDFGMATDMNSNPIPVGDQPDCFDRDYYSARTFVCEFCPRAFIDTADLAVHIGIDHSAMTVDDRGVEVEEELFAAPAVDEESIDVDEESFGDDYYRVRTERCADCPRAYISKRALSHHIRLKHYTPSTVAKGMNATAATVEQLQQPQAQALQPQTPTMPLKPENPQLSTANIVFDSAYYLLRTHRCHLCPKAYTIPHNLRTHCRNTHGTEPNVPTPLGPDTRLDDRPFKCIRCAQSFGSKSSLRRHGIAIHHVKVGGRKKKSRFGAAKGPTSRGMTVDDRMTTGSGTAQRPFSCPACRIGFNTRQSLKAHMNRAHRTTLSRIPKSNAPDVVYDAAYYADRPYRCEHCERASTTHGHLRSHLKLMHNITLANPKPSKARLPVFDADYYAARPHACTICRRAYKSRQAVILHMTQDHDIGEGDSALRDLTADDRELETFNGMEEEAVDPSLDGRFDCPNCDLALTTLIERAVHLQTCRRPEDNSDGSQPMSIDLGQTATNGQRDGKKSVKNGERKTLKHLFG